MVLPAPSSPETSTTSPGRSSAASSAPARSVASAPDVRTAQGDPGREEHDAGERDPARADAGAGELLGLRGRRGPGAGAGAGAGAGWAGWAGAGCAGAGCAGAGVAVGVGSDWACSSPNGSWYCSSPAPCARAADGTARAHSSAAMMSRERVIERASVSPATVLARWRRVGTSWS